MTKEELKKRVLDTFNSSQDDIENKIDHLLASGCIEVENYPNSDYTLIKAICYNLAKELVIKFKPMSRKCIDEANNISKFI